MAADGKRPDNIAPPAEEDLPLTNFEVIQKLSFKFAEFIESTGVSIPPVLLTLLKGTDPAAKIAFLRTHLRMDQIEKLVRDHAAEKGIADSEKINKCIKYLEAMCEVATV